VIVRLAAAPTHVMVALATPFTSVVPLFVAVTTWAPGASNVNARPATACPSAFRMAVTLAVWPVAVGTIATALTVTTYAGRVTVV
jgi:hypothetical protein